MHARRRPGILTSAAQTSTTKKGIKARMGGFAPFAVTRKQKKYAHPGIALFFGITSVCILSH